MHYKTFPKTMDGSNYPVWEEISLTDKDEFAVEDRAKKENIKLMKRCVAEARKMLEEVGMREYQSDILNIALAIFRKQASHVVYWKDNLCKEKFDRAFKR